MQKFNTLVVVGAQWGDEGKGKMTDFFGQKADIVARFAGGDNAGHIINFNGRKQKVTIIPSGIFNPNTVNIIGNGCVVNLTKLTSEYNELKANNKQLGELLISNRAHIILPYHHEIDAAQEESKGDLKIGTTKKGIGPAYQDKVSRIGIRLCDINQKDFKSKLKNIVIFQNKYLKNIYNVEPLKFDSIYNELISCYKQIENKIIDTGLYLDKAIDDKKKVLFEGAQGALLDIDHGTYPFVTSSNTSANNASLGSGFSHKKIQTTLGVVKAYNTRVGAGAFPTELNDEIGNKIRKAGNEYGSNTGRPRRVGWLDGVALNYAIRTSGIDNIFITLLDVLTGFDKIKICYKYVVDNNELETIPPTNTDYQKCKPVYMEMDGWNEDITNVKSLDELPINAQNYLKKIEQICNIKISGFSVGPDRTQTVVFDNFFN